MGLLDKLFERRELSAAEGRSLSLTNYREWVEQGLASPNASGAHVTPSSAMKMSAVFACIRILAEDLASLPLIVYRRMSQGKQRAQAHYLYTLLKDRPNPWMTSFEYRETIQAHLAAWGNAYSQVTYNGRGQVTELFPLRPDHMLENYRENGRRYYKYMLPGGQIKVIAGEFIWHLRGLGSDGLNGYSPISLMRQAVGLGVAAEEFGARFFGNDARPGIVLEHPGTLNDQAQKNLKKSWETEHSGLDKKWRMRVLEEGMKLHEVGIPPEDAQFLETRKFQIQEIARIYRMPPHKLADLDRATFSNIEHQSIEYVVNTLRPWLKRWEQSITQNLFLSSDRRNYFVEFLMEDLLRGDTQARYEAYSTGRMNGWLSANDIRELENMNPIDGGDVYLVPLNMIPAPQAGDFGAPPAARENRAVGPEEDRQQRALALRRRLMKSHQPLLEAALKRVYVREINDVGAEFNKVMRERQFPLFENWLKRFYEDHKGFIIRQVRPVFQAYGELLAAAAADEVASEIHPDAVENFVNSYSKSFADRSAGNSQARIQTALDAEDTEKVMQAQFDNWRTIRVGRTAFAEAVQQANAVAKMVFATAGRTALRWVAFGDNCPYCSRLNGQVVGIQENFLTAGAEFQPEGAESPLRPSVDIGHAPAHDGCDCLVAAA